MRQGIEKGKDNTSYFIKILTNKTWSAEGNAMMFLLVVDEEKYYHDLGKKSWKMRTMSLMYCMIHVYEYCTNSDVVNDVVNVYFQAWDFMELVDSSDPEIQFSESTRNLTLFGTFGIKSPKLSWKGRLGHS